MLVHIPAFAGKDYTTVEGRGTLLRGRITAAAARIYRCRYSRAHLSPCRSGLTVAEDGVKATDEGDKPGSVQAITPEAKPREVSEDDIDTEFFEIGVYAGVLNIDNFGSEAVYGVNASFHATEDFFLQGNYGISKATHRLKI